MRFDDEGTLIETPTMPAQYLETRRARLARLTRPELVALYLALPGRRKTRTQLSNEALIEMLAWFGTAA